MDKEKVHIGIPKFRKVLCEKPQKKFRVIIQERKAKGNSIERSRSFMIFDFTGKSKIDNVKKQLMKLKLEEK